MKRRCTNTDVHKRAALAASDQASTVTGRAIGAGGGQEMR